MKNVYKAFVLFFGLFLLTPVLVSAHQPRITQSRITEVSSPEISKAYYGELRGEPDIYILKAATPFNLYANVLVPDILDQKKDVSVVILKDDRQIAVLDGSNFVWKQFYEPFGADTYWMGPEYRMRAEAGTYEIRVSSGKNDSKYSLAIGEVEAFDGKEGLNALIIIPKLKKSFFNESPIGFIRSPFGKGLIVSMYLLAAVVGFVYRAILKKIANRTSRGSVKNIGTFDRLLRFMLGFGLLVWAITTSWSPILLFFSGFCFFEAIFSWCGLYAALGKNTCPSQ